MMTAPVTAKHSCWSYDGRRELEACARAYLGAGLAAGERVWYAAADGPGEMSDWLAEAARARPGAVRFVPLGTAYPADALVEPETQVAEYAEATAEALAAGYSGLRVIADATPLVRTAAQFNAFARYETLVERYIADAPMRAVCGYDRTALGDRPVAELACLHSGSNVAEARFSLRAGPPGGPAAVLDGELDLTADEIFPAALAHVRPRPTDGRIVIDARELRFFDHRALLHLDRYAADSAAVVVLRTPMRTAGLLLELVEPAFVQVEAVR
jgi:hypothetical protein